jgi:hypothetical protein
MKNKHRNIQEWIKETYSQKYNVFAEIDKQNKLPDQQGHWYQPDLIMYNEGKDICYIIEIENDPVRKALVGASLLADASICELKQIKIPKLIFIVYSKEGLRQIPNFVEKLNIAKRYCQNLSSIEIYSENEFKMLV